MSLKKFLIKFSLILIVFSIFVGKSFSLEPKEFVQSVTNEASLILTKNFTREQKIEKLKSIAEKTVDFRGIGYYSLGAHRKNLSDDKKKEYFNIFEKYFLKSFSSRLAEYTDPKIRVDSQKKLNEKYTMVSSVLLATAKRPEVKIDWRVVTKNPDNPLIIDVIIEGVSLAKVQREEFNSIIQNNDNNIDALLNNLKEFVNKDS
jgi:phospholipid transport system substrate-binding protein